MKFTREMDSAVNLVTAYRSGEIRIGHRIVRQNLILTASEIVDGWPAQAAASLTRGQLEPVLALAPQIIVLGTGPRLEFPARDVSAWVLQQGIGLEVMDTAAACRTYNVLVLEERAVAAALLI